MARNIWEMFRGDYKTKRIIVSAGVYTAGGKLFFAAKLQPDNDTSDSTAAVKKDMTDDDIVETLDNGDKVFLMRLESEDTTDVSITEDTEYIGEIQYVNASGQPTTYEPFIFKLRTDINRRTS